MKRLIPLLFMIAASCGGPEHEDHRSGPPAGETTEDKIDKLQRQVLDLLGTNTQITTLIETDFATCPMSGDTADALVNKICKISQAANVEQLVAIKGQLATLSESFTEKLNAINDNIIQVTEQAATDVAAINSQITTITGQIATITSQITTLQTQMTSANSAITALQTLTASITATLNGTMASLDIGTENLSAGPLYESILRKVDKSRINAYAEAFSTNVTLANNTLDPTNASPTLIVTKPTATITVTIATPGVVTWTAHSFAAGDPVMFSTTGTLPTGIVALTVYYVRTPAANTFQLSATLGGAAINTTGSQSGTHTGSFGTAANDLLHLSGFTSGSGIATGDVAGDFVVATAPNVSTFTITLRRNASSTAVFGGNQGYIYRVFGRGMATVWKTADGADTAVRNTTLGTKRYNWAVTSIGDICYDKVVATQTFANIITTPTVDVVCK